MLVFLFNFLECQNAVHYILIKNSPIFHKKVKFWAAKATKIIKFWIFSKMLTSAKCFAEFQCFDKKITQSMSLLPKKTRIKTKYIDVKKTEKVELDNFM